MRSLWNAKVLRVLVPMLAGVALLGLATEISARGRGGGGRGGGVYRGGPARGGSIRNERSGGGHRSYGGGQAERRQRSGGFDRDGTAEREGSFENRRGEAVDYSGSATRTEDGIQSEGSWSSTSGASGGGSGDVKFKNGRVESTDRSRHAENADGDTLNRDIQSERHGDHMDRQGQIKSSTGIDAESRGTLKKTDDGFIARGGIAGKDGVAGGTIVRDGDQTRIRGGATDGKNATWGRAHCNGSHCYGGRVKVKVKDYDYHPYYYYPYYYGYYSCPYGGMQTWYGSYGTPVYGCSNVTVIHTTISMGSTSTNYLTAPSESSSFSGPKAEKPVAESDWPDEAEVSSEPVLMYEVSDEVVVYATPNDPAGVYSRKHGERYYWTPGPASRSTEVAGWLESAEGMETPTANATVIQYKLGKRVVYLTNERPVPDVYAESVDHLFVWIPGVKDPSEEDRALIAQVGKAHRSGGKGALDREVRKLQKDRDPPPPVEGPATS